MYHRISIILQLFFLQLFLLQLFLIQMFLYTNHIYYTFSFHHINNHQCIGLTPKCFQTRQFSNWDVYNLQANQPILQLFPNTNHFHYTFSFHHINNHQCIGLTLKCFQTRQFSNRDLYNFQLFLHTNDFYIRVHSELFYEQLKYTIIIVLSTVTLPCLQYYSPGFRMYITI